jgi:hypothetical protein
MSPKTPCGSLMPAASNFSLNFGRMPVGRSFPCTLPSMYAVLGDVRDLARAVLEATDLHDQVERARDLLADGARRQVGAGHEAHRLEAADHVSRRVRVTGREAAVVAGVHGLEHRERLATADLTHDDALWAHTEGVLDQVHDRDRALAFDVRRA